jgi:SAM-dependent methyltransferase
VDTLHPLAAQFASVADAYERGRPEYPPAAVGALAAELGLSPGARILDLAAGTGKLSRALLAAGFDVVAVEPLDSLRALLSERIGADRVKAGVAEQIPLGDAEVDAVTAADAFHWFDQARALREIRRVLRPRGGLVVLSMVPDWSGASWAHELGSFMAAIRPQHPHFDGPSWQAAVIDAGGWSTPREIRVTTTEPTDAQRILDHMMSMSWIAAMADDERQAAAERMRGFVQSGETPAELPQHVVIGLARLVS